MNPIFSGDRATDSAQGQLTRQRQASFATESPQKIATTIGIQFQIAANTSKARRKWPRSMTVRASRRAGSSWKQILEEARSRNPILQMESEVTRRSRVGSQ